MNHLRAAWERVLLYLPLLVVGVAALGTYWLVRSTPPPHTSSPARAHGHTPDYFLKDFSIQTFDAQGRVRTEVRGRQAQHYPDTQWLEIDAIMIRSTDAQGRLTTATALRGLSNDDASEVQLLGQARVIREPFVAPDGSASPRLEFRGEFLHAFLTQERVTSHKPVELWRGNDRMQAESLAFDNAEQVLEMRGRVRALLLPSRTSP